MLTEKFSDEKILENFLFSEIQSAELYREIINFIGSYEIRHTPRRVRGQRVHHQKA